MERIRLTNLKTYTIDDIGTDEIDDAISIEAIENNWRIWIHIADPTETIPFNSELDIRARKIGTSMYLPTGIKHMFPKEISTNNMSLLQGCERNALSAGIIIDINGEIIDYELHQTIIKPNYHLTYEEANELIELSPPEEEDLSILFDLMKSRHSFRVKSGAITIDIPKGKFTYKNNKLELYVIEPTMSRFLISEAMILFGSVVANHANIKGISIPYRYQPKSNLEPTSSYSINEDNIIESQRIINRLYSAKISIDPKPHFSLGLRLYTQATSPIRRYLDLLVLRQIIGFLNGKPIIGSNELNEIILEVKKSLNQAINITRESQNECQNLWFKENIGKQISGFVIRWLRPSENIALVYIDELLMNVACRLQTKGNNILFTKRLFLIKEIDPIYNQTKLIQI